MKVFLGGTVNGSKWRNYLESRLKIDYFNPVVDDWNEEAYKKELYERKNCDYCLYVLTPKMTGYYAIAEVIDDSYQRPDRTIYCYLPTDQEAEFTSEQNASMSSIGKRVEQNGGIWLGTLDQVIAFLNSSKDLKPSMLDGDKRRYDVFISYGRKHSKDFATKLCKSLTDDKYDVWFDQNDIPLGVDFQEQINDGITRADNFVFIISPHSVRSEYCLKEIVLAVELNKRIIPILHVEPKEDWDKMHPTIEKLNWIYFQEHINDYNRSYNGLTDLMASHKDYVHKHTDLLLSAINWEKQGKAIALMLVGIRQKKAEEWLKTEFADTQPPCSPIEIHCRYICESKEYAQNYMNDVFLCYSEKDKMKVDLLCAMLNRKGITAWTKEKNVKPGKNYKEEAHSGIEKSINIIYFLSKNTIADKNCRQELSYALKNNKRVIPIQIQQMESEESPESIRGLFMLKWLGDDSGRAMFSNIMQVLAHDTSYLEKHRHLLSLALEWVRLDRPQNKLLHGFDLSNYTDWIAEHNNRKTFAPTALQKKFVTESESSRTKVFISYGRKHSKDFSTKLCEQLLSKGFDVWFDQNDIPLGVDFQNQIDEGIFKSENFIFVISPHSVKSIYCLKEIELAVKYNKRIIPLLHVEPSDCWEKMHPTIEKLNWIYFQEGINIFEESFKGLVDLMHKHTAYIKQHTELLNKALYWKKQNESTDLLLFGKNKIDAIKWLETEFLDEQSPCQPSVLHAEYICESKKHTELNRTDVFFSYAREDAEYRDKIRNSLMNKGITTWVDTSDIKSGTSFAEAINSAIENADNFLYLITPFSVKSEYCLMELKHVLKFNKRIIPVLLSETPLESIPKELQTLQFVTMTNSIGDDNKPSRTEKSAYEKSIVELINEVKKDYDYHRFSKDILALALKWERQNENPAVLLRGLKLELANTWLSTGLKRSDYSPIDKQKDFVKKSEDYKTDTINTEVFISYALNDYDLAYQLNDILQTQGKTTWFDQQYIVDNLQYDKYTAGGIETSDNFLFIVSPDSANDKHCLKQFLEADRMGKRIIPIHYKVVSPEEMPTFITKKKGIDFYLESSDFQTCFNELIRALDVDREYVQSHTKWSLKATAWHNDNKSSDLLLHGNEFTLAEAWYNDALEKNKKPAPRPLQKEYITESKNAILTLVRRRKRRAFIMKVMVIVMSCLLVVAIILSILAYRNSKEANKQRNIALVEQEKALKAKAFAELQEQEAIKSEQEAKKSKDKAVQAKFEAEREREQAKKNEREALRQKERADQNKIEADKERDKAKEKEREAQIEKENAQKERDKAKIANEKSTRLFLLSEAKSLSKKAKELLNDGDVESSKILALHAYFINKDFGGPVQSQGNYSALQSILNKEKPQKQDEDEKHNQGISAIAYSSNNVIASGGNGGYIYLRDNHDKKSKIEKIELKSRINKMKFSPNGSYIIVGTDDGRLVRCSLKKNTLGKTTTQTIGSYQSAINGISIANDPATNTDFALVSLNDTLALWNFNDNESKLLYSLPTENLSASSFFINNKQKLVVAADTDGNISLYSLIINAEKATLKLMKQIEFGRKITAITFSPDGKYIAVGANNGFIEVLTSSNLVAYKTLLGHNSYITNFSFHPEGHQLASASLDGTVRLWLFQGNKQEEAIVLKHPSKWVWSTEYNHDSSMIISGGEDGFVHQWPVKSSMLADELCPTVNSSKSKEVLEKYSKADVQYKSKNCVSYK